MFYHSLLIAYFSSLGAASETYSETGEHLWKSSLYNGFMNYYKYLACVFYSIYKAMVPQGLVENEVLHLLNPCMNWTDLASSFTHAETTMQHDSRDRSPISWACTPRCQTGILWGDIKQSRYPQLATRFGEYDQNGTDEQLISVITGYKYWTAPGTGGVLCPQMTHWSQKGMQPNCWLPGIPSLQVLLMQM